MPKRSAWQYTREEYDALSLDERFSLTDPAFGARPHHSNYHMLAVMQAVKEGKDVCEANRRRYADSIKHMD